MLPFCPNAKKKIKHRAGLSKNVIVVVVVVVAVALVKM